MSQPPGSARQAQAAPGPGAPPQSPFIDLLYRFRWPAALLMLLFCAGVMAAGWGRIADFSQRVDSLADPPPEDPQPRMFDPRSDIWFDPNDQALAAFYDIEEQFVGEDIAFAAFEEREDPHGVFGVKSLERIARVSEKLEQIPFVRNVRSLTDNPWIRWGEVAPGEQGLIVSDLFEEPPASYSEEQRISRMIAILGAERAAALIGEQAVRAMLGADADFADHIGEPRLIRGIVSEDGRATAIQIQILRPRLTDARLAEAFGEDASDGKAIAPAIHTSTMQGGALDAIDAILAQEAGVEWHLAGVPVLERHFPKIGQSDMRYVGLMFVAIAVILLIVYRRVGGVVMPMMIVIATIMGMNGTVWVKGDLMNNLTAIAPNIMTAVGVADSVHLVTAYYLLRPKHDDKRQLIMEVLRLNAVPVFLTSITTAIGFFSLTTSDIVPMRTLGYTAGIGTLLAYLLSMTVIPAMLSLIPLRKPAGMVAEPESLDHDDLDHWSAKLVAFTSKNRVVLTALTLMAFVTAGYGLTQMRFSSDMRIMFPEDDPVRRDLEWLGDNLGGAGDLEFVFRGPKPAGSPQEADARLSRIAQLQLKRNAAEVAKAAPVAESETETEAAPGSESGSEPETGSESESAPEPPPELTAAEAQELAKLESEEREYRRRRIGASAELLGKVDAFQARLEAEAQKPGGKLEKLTNFDSGLSVLRKMHQVQNENRPAFYRVPVEDDVPIEARQPTVLVDEVLEEETFIPAQNASSMASQYYLQYENGAKPSENLASMITPDRRSFRVSARVDQGPTHVLLEAFDEIRRIADAHFPEIRGTPAAVEDGSALSTMTMTGRFYLYMNMMTRFVGTLVESLSLALLAITLLIVFVYRSLTLGAVSLIPNVLPIITPLGLMGLLGVPLDGPAVLVAAVALGVCVDDTIHFITKYSSARKEGLGIDAALRKAFRLVGPALTWTTIVLVLGFSVLMLSDFRPNIVIGILGSIMIFLAWFADFVLLPAVLSLIGREST